VRASPEHQRRLLELQEHDSGLDRLATRRRTLPALAVIAASSEEIARLEREAVDHETASSDIGRDQRKLENDIDQVRSRATRDQQRLDTGSVSSAKELESLQHELGSLAHRQSDLEDELLELMEQREQAEAALKAVRAAQAAAQATQRAAEAERDAAFADIAVEAERLSQERAALAGDLPADLLALYERIRADKGGVGAALLTRARCEGCHLELSGAELGSVRDAPADEVVRCEDCGRILVRTEVSGL
jgi:predicted  nucleic acid-binding Zn-ribbon protein